MIKIDDPYIICTYNLYAASPPQLLLSLWVLSFTGNPDMLGYGLCNSAIHSV